MDKLRGCHYLQLLKESYGFRVNFNVASLFIHLSFYSYLVLRRNTLSHPAFIVDIQCHDSRAIAKRIQRLSCLSNNIAFQYDPGIVTLCLRLSDGRQVWRQPIKATPWTPACFSPETKLCCCAVAINVRPVNTIARSVFLIICLSSYLRISARSQCALNPR